MSETTEKKVDPVSYVLDEGQPELELERQLDELSPLPTAGVCKSPRRIKKRRIPNGVFDCEYHPGLIGFLKDATMRKRKVSTLNSMNYVRYNDTELRRQIFSLLLATTYDESDYEELTREERSKKSKKDKISRGEESQADVPEFSDIPTASATGGETCPITYDKIWDPARYDAKPTDQVDKMDKFLKHKRDTNMTYHLMDLVHQSDYDLELAKSRFVAGPEFDRSVEFNDAQKGKFDSILNDTIAKQKDFGQAAEQIDCSREAVMVNYYVWKGANRDKAVFKRLKDERNREEDSCHVCTDGGSLVVCDLCKKAFHAECHDPPISAEPHASKTWYCSGCRISSPARLRHSVGVGYPNSDDSPQANSLQRPKTPLTKKDIAYWKAIHKELSSKPKPPHAQGIRKQGGTKKNLTCVPSGMIWDEAEKVWIESPKQAKGVARDDSKGLSENTPRHEADGGSTSGSNDESDASHQSDSPGDNVSQSDESGQQSDEEYVDSEGEEKQQQQQQQESSSRRVVPQQIGKVAALPSQKAYRSPPIPSCEFPGKLVYYASIPLTLSGLKIIVLFHENSCVFGSYNRLGSIGSAEKAQVFVSSGDRVIGVDGETCLDKNGQEIVKLLRKPTSNSVKILKMLHTPLIHPVGITTNPEAEYRRSTDSSIASNANNHNPTQHLAHPGPPHMGHHTPDTHQVDIRLTVGVNQPPPNSYGSPVRTQAPPVINRRMFASVHSRDLSQFWADFAPLSVGPHFFSATLGLVCVHAVLYGGCPDAMASALAQKNFLNFDQARDIIGDVRLKLKEWVDRCD